MTSNLTGRDAYILFELAGSTYALRSDDIQQLEMVAEPTPVPNAPPYVEGVVAVRGQVMPVVDLRARFGFPRRPHDLRSRLLIVRVAGRVVGLVVDSAREFAMIPSDSIKPAPEGVGALSTRWLSGLAQRGDRLILVLDAVELLNLETSMTPAPDQATSAPVSA